MKMIPYSRQTIEQDDIDAVVNVLRSDFLTQGPKIEEFENSIKNYCQSSYAVAVSNGTAALHLALLALSIGKDDIVWTSPISFVASSNCVLYCGARVGFVDCDPVTGNIDVAKLEVRLAQCSKLGMLPKLLIVVHYTGRVSDIEKINNLSKKYGFLILEDAAHALGANYRDGSKVGNCQYSDFTMFSFHPVKSITTGEGGVLTTNNNDLAQKIKILRSHGISRDKNFMKDLNQGRWYYEQQLLGYNYRLTDIQAALGISQMTKLDNFIKLRRDLADRYQDLLSKLPLKLPLSDNNSAWHLYVLQVDSKKISKREVFDHMVASGIGVNVHYIPIHTQPYYLEIGFKIGDFPVSESFYNDSISIPLFPTLSFEQQDYVVKKLKEVLVE